MKGNRRNPYTVSHGHGLQAVKRAASDIEFLDSSSRVSRKRPVRERLGIRLDSPSRDRNEDSSLRQSGDGIYCGNGADDNARIGQDDLRYKLIQKAASRRAQDDDERDLREKLITMRGPPQRSVEIHRHTSESSRSNIPELRPSSRPSDDLMRTGFSRSYSSSGINFLRQGTGTSKGLSPPGNLDGPPRQHISRDYEYVRAAPSVSRGMFDALRQRVVTSRGLSPPGNPDRVQGRHISREYEDMRVAPRNMLDAPRQSTGAARGLTPPRNLDRIQVRNINREYEDVRGSHHVSRGMRDAQKQSVATARGLSPPRNSDRRHISREYEDGRVARVSRSTPGDHRQNIGTSKGLPSPRDLDRLQGQRMSIEYEDIRVAPHESRCMLDTPRQMSSASFDTRPRMPPPVSQPPSHPVIAKPRTLPAPLGDTLPPVLAAQSLSRLPLPGNEAHRAVPLAEEHQTVDSLLKSLGLEKFSILFFADQVDMAALKQMDESDLKELGIPMGPRKKILHSLRPPPDGQ